MAGLVMDYANMKPIQIQNLGSGSRGNCTIIRHQNNILMIDCGFSGRLTHLNTRPVHYATPVDHAGFTITPIRISHDTTEPCAFLVEVAGRRTLFLTDIGTTEGFDLSLLTDLDYLYIEANHDEAMLRDGPYPAFLKQRIAGVGGHLNNRQCGELVRSLAAQSPGLKAVMLAHLSDKNNAPGLALAAVRDVAGDLPGVRWAVARQAEAVALG